jgi:hypothetical protein
VSAGQIIDATSFGPEALKVIREAFDKAWSSIAGNFGDEPSVVEAARHKLANALLSVASDDSRDPDVLAVAALQAMARSYRW